MVVSFKLITYFLEVCLDIFNFSFDTQYFCIKFEFFLPCFILIFLEFIVSNIDLLQILLEFLTVFFELKLSIGNFFLLHNDVFFKFLGFFSYIVHA